MRRRTLRAAKLLLGRAVDRKLPAPFVRWSNLEAALSNLRVSINTLWLFAGARRGIMIYRAAVVVQEIDGSDVADIMIVYERPSDPAIDRPLTERRGLPLDPRTAARTVLAARMVLRCAEPRSLALGGRSTTPRLP